MASKRTKSSLSSSLSTSSIESATMTSSMTFTETTTISTSPFSQSPIPSIINSSDATSSDIISQQQIARNIMVGMIIGFLLISVGAFFYFYSKKKDSEEDGSILYSHEQVKDSENQGVKDFNLSPTQSYLSQPTSTPVFNDLHLPQQEFHRNSYMPDQRLDYRASTLSYSAVYR